MNEKLFGGTEP